MMVNLEKRQDVHTMRLWGGDPKPFESQAAYGFRRVHADAVVAFHRRTIRLNTERRSVDVAADILRVAMV